MLLRESILISLLFLFGMFVQEGDCFGLDDFFNDLSQTIEWVEWGEWEHESECYGNRKTRARSGNATLSEIKYVPCSGTSFCEPNPCPSGEACLESSLQSLLSGGLINHFCWETPFFPDTNALTTTRTPDLRALPPMDSDDGFWAYSCILPKFEWVEWGEWEHESECTGNSKTRTRFGNATLEDTKCEPCSDTSFCASCPPENLCIETLALCSYWPF